MAHPSPAQIQALLIGKLEPRAAAGISEHLESCPQCSRTAQELDGTVDSFVAQFAGLSSAPPAPDQHLRQALASVKAAVRGSSPVTSNVVTVEGPLLPPLAGRQVREYQLLAKLGEGAMGTVYQARHARLDKIVALKVLPAHRRDSSEAIARFEREMRAIGRLSDPHLIGAHDAGDVDGLHFLVMEYVHGSDLSKIVRSQGPLKIADACEVVRQAALGLAYVHQNGLVHRDIKPSNLMLAESGQVKILDLGLALLQSEVGGEQKDLTSSGHVMGTIDYMAPEQAGVSHEVDCRADIYSLGATLYTLLTGRPPLAGDDTDTPVKKVLALTARMPRPLGQLRADAPRALAEFVLRMLAKAPNQRPQTASEVAAALAPWTDQHRLDLVVAAALREPAEVRPSVDAGLAPVKYSDADTSDDRRSSPTGELPSCSDMSQGGASSPNQVDTSPYAKVTKRRELSRPRAVLIGLSAAMFALAAVGVWIVVKNSEGRVIGKMQIPEGGSATLFSGRNRQSADRRSAPGTGAPRASSPGFATERAAAEWALRTGGTVAIEVAGEPVEVQRADQLPNTDFYITGIDLTRLTVKDHDLARLTGLSHLGSLVLRETLITDKGLPHLDALKSLKRLVLYGTKVTDKVFDTLLRLPELDDLSITGTQTTSAGWRRLGELPKLSGLDVALLPFADADLERLAAVQPELQRLNLWGTAVSDGAIFHLARFRELRALYLNFTNLSGQGITPLLDSLPHLEVFQIAHLKSADEAAKALAQAGVMKSFKVTHSSYITDEGLMYLGKIKSIEELDIGIGRTTSAGVADLAGLPNLRSLRLQASLVSDESAGLLSQMKKLSRLELVISTAIPGQVMTEQGFELLSRLESLKELRLRNHKLPEGGLGHLARMPNLMLLELRDCVFSDRDAFALAESRSLATLIILNGSALTPSTVERLRAARPAMDIQLTGK